MVRQKRVRLRTDPPELNVQTPEGMKTIKSNVSERLLGINLQNDTSWKSHLQTGEKPLMSALRKRPGGLETPGDTSAEKWQKIAGNRSDNIKINIYDSSLGRGADNLHKEATENSEQFSQVHTKWGKEMEDR